MRAFLIFLSIVLVCFSAGAYDEPEEVKEKAKKTADQGMAKASEEVKKAQEKSAEEVKKAEKRASEMQKEGEKLNELSHLDEKGFGFHLNLNMPFLLTYGLDFSLNRHVSFALETGTLSLNFTDTKVSLSTFDARARYHIWGESFFVGGGLGKRNFTGKLSGVYSGGFTTSVESKADTTFFYPHIGWYTRYQSGFTLQFEVGFQSTMSNSSSSDVQVVGASAAERAVVEADSEYIKAKKDLDDSLDRLGKIGVPVIVFLGVGWLF